MPSKLSTVIGGDIVSKCIGSINDLENKSSNFISEILADAPFIGEKLLSNSRRSPEGRLAISVGLLQFLHHQIMFQLDLALTGQPLFFLSIISDTNSRPVYLFH